MTKIPEFCRELWQRVLWKSADASDYLLATVFDVVLFV